MGKVSEAMDRVQLRMTEAQELLTGIQQQMLLGQVTMNQALYDKLEAAKENYERAVAVYQERARNASGKTKSFKSKATLIQEYNATIQVFDQTVIQRIESMMWSMVHVSQTASST